MKVLITGICGFVGSSLAEGLLERHAGISVLGVDNLMRPGSELNRVRLRELGIAFAHGDIRNASDLESLPGVDWVIDAAANPSVLAGIQSGFSSRQLVEHNLAQRGECAGILQGAARRSGIAEHQPRLLRPGTGIAAAARRGRRFSSGRTGAIYLREYRAKALAEDFSTRAPISLYGSTKLAAETLALEYGEAFDFPVWINRCGVLAGAGQFGTPDQGVFSYWIHAHARRHPLRFIGFDGTGQQTRDVFHPRDLTALRMLR